MLAQQQQPMVRPTALARATPPSPATILAANADAADQAKPTLQMLNFGGLDRDKTLVSRHFSFAYTHAAKLRTLQGSNNDATMAPRPPTTPSPHGGTPTRGRERAVLPSPPTTHELGQTGKATYAACCQYLLQLTPSCKERERRSARSGRVLTESESLQAKHTDEYNFIIPVLGHALSQTIAEHDVIRCEEGQLRAEHHALSPSVARFQTGKEVRMASSRNGLHEDGGGGGAAAAAPSDTDLDSSSDVSDSDETSSSCSASDNDASDGGVEGGPHRQPPRSPEAKKKRRRERKAALTVGPASLAAFYKADGPTMTPLDFLKRIVKYSFASPSALVAACFYIDRLLMLHPALLLTKENYFLLLLIAARVASKFFDTRTLNNRDFALVGGIANKELNTLEVIFLENLGYELYISPEEFLLYASDLVNAALGGTRGNPVKQATPHQSDGDLVLAVTETLENDENANKCDALPTASPESGEASPLPPPQSGSGAAAAAAGHLGSRVMRGSRRPSTLVAVAPLAAPPNVPSNNTNPNSPTFADRRARSLSLMSQSSQSGVMLPSLRSASRPALPPAMENSVDGNISLRHSALGLDEEGSASDVVINGSSHNNNNSSSSNGTTHRNFARVLHLSTADDTNAPERSEDTHDRRGADPQPLTGGRGSAAAAPSDGPYSALFPSASAAKDTAAATPLSVEEGNNGPVNTTRRAGSLSGHLPPPQPPQPAITTTSAENSRSDSNNTNRNRNSSEDGAAAAARMCTLQYSRTTTARRPSLIAVANNNNNNCSSEAREGTEFAMTAIAPIHMGSINGSNQTGCIGAALPLPASGRATQRNLDTQHTDTSNSIKKPAAHAPQRPQPQPPTPALNTTYRHLRPARHPSGNTTVNNITNGASGSNTARVGSTNRSGGGSLGNSWKDLQSAATTRVAVSNTRANLLYQQQQLLLRQGIAPATTNGSAMTGNSNGSLGERRQSSTGAPSANNSFFGNNNNNNGSVEQVSSERLQYLPSSSTVSETPR